ncbi:MAG: hypothetical protein U5M51_02435 [Emticicia sp.]|nr:hypothetical protein [Emticicia sp.]
MKVIIDVPCPEIALYKNMENKLHKLILTTLGLLIFLVSQARNITPEPIALTDSTDWVQNIVDEGTNKLFSVPSGSSFFTRP